MTDEQEAPKIHIDSDWKAQAQAEKQKLADESKKAFEGEAGAGAKAGPAKPGDLPPANFDTLMSTLVTQALFAMGAIADPRTGQRVAHLDLARHHIDMLAVLEEKTKGNLTEQESTALATTVYELRSRYVQMSNTSRQVAKP